MMSKQIRVTVKDSPVVDELMELLGIKNHTQLINYVLIDYRRLLNSSNKQTTGSSSEQTERKQTKLSLF